MDNGTILWITFIICVFFVWFFTHKAKHKERMTMIENGIHRDDFFQGKNHFRFPWLKLGIVTLGFGLGLLIIAFLASFGLLKNAGPMELAILGVCGGISLVIAGRIKNDKTKN